MAIILTDNKHYKNIAAKIREKTGTDVTYKPSDMVNGINDVYEKGIEDGGVTVSIRDNVLFIEKRSI